MRIENNSIHAQKEKGGLVFWLDLFNRYTEIIRRELDDALGYITDEHKRLKYNTQITLVMADSSRKVNIIERKKTKKWQNIYDKNT